MFEMTENGKADAGSTRITDTERLTASYLAERHERLKAQLELLASQAAALERARQETQAELNRFHGELARKYDIGPRDRVHLPEGIIERVAPADAPKAETNGHAG